MSLYRLKGASGAVMNQAFPLTSRLLIGRADDCDLRLDEPGVQSHHAEVQILDDQSVLLRCLAPSAEVFVNGIKTSEQLLGSGDELRIGTSRLIVQAPGLRPERVISEVSTAKNRHHWPWLLLLAGALSALLAWQRGWMPF